MSCVEAQKLEAYQPGIGPLDSHATIRITTARVRTQPWVPEFLVRRDWRRYPPVRRNPGIAWIRYSQCVPDRCWAGCITNTSW
jgi:hypothetical protein